MKGYISIWLIFKKSRIFLWSLSLSKFYEFASDTIKIITKKLEIFNESRMLTY